MIVLQSQRPQPVQVVTATFCFLRVRSIHCRLGAQEPIDMFGYAGGASALATAGESAAAAVGRTYVRASARAMF
jgi:hypothetical protein